MEWQRRNIAPCPVISESGGEKYTTSDEFKHAYREVAKKMGEIDVIGLLLSPNPYHSVSKVIKSRWQDLYYASGEHLLVVFFQNPSQWSEVVKEDLKRRLGEDFDKYWKEWQIGTEPGKAWKYVELFEDPKIDESQLPCLVFFTSAENSQAVVRTIPDWGEIETYEFLNAIFHSINGCCKYLKDDTPDQRIERIRKAVTSPSAKLSSYQQHVKRKISRFARDNPGFVAKMAFSIIVGATGAFYSPAIPLMAILVAISDKL